MVNPGENGTCDVSVVWELARGVLQLTLLSLQRKWAPAYLWGLSALVAPFVLCVNVAKECLDWL